MAKGDHASSASTCPSQFRVDISQKHKASRLLKPYKPLPDMSKPPPLKLGVLDNKSAIDLAPTILLQFRNTTRKPSTIIERRHYFIRECVENGKLRVAFVPTKDNVADFFTKV